MPFAACCRMQKFSQESLDFQERISQRNGLGDGKACLPPALHILPKPIITMQVRRTAAMQSTGSMLASGQHMHKLQRPTHCGKVLKLMPVAGHVWQH